MGRLFCAENGDFSKFYTNFTKKLVTFRVLLRLYKCRSRSSRPPSHGSFVKGTVLSVWVVLGILYDTPSIGRSVWVGLFFWSETQNRRFYIVLYKFYRKFCDFVGSFMPTIDRSRSPKSPSRGSVGIKSPVSVSGF